MREPSPRSSRLALAGAVAAALVVAGTGFLLGRNSVDAPPVPVSPAVVPAAPKQEPVSELNNVLGRSDLIMLAAQAADAAAAGHAPNPNVAHADGRRFELRLPFGCDEPATEDSKTPMRWGYDAERETFRVHVSPEIWSAADWLPAKTPEVVDAVEEFEGFWIARPWTSSEACAARIAEPASVVAASRLPPEQTLAIGQPFFAGSARDSRRNGEAYETVVRIAEDKLDVSQGLRLRIAGRINPVPGAGTILCHHSSTAQQRPVCLISVTVDEVAIENPATGDTLATWGVGGRSLPDRTVS